MLNQVAAGEDVQVQQVTCSLPVHDLTLPPHAVHAVTLPPHAVRAVQAVLRCARLRHHVASLGGNGADGAQLVDLLAAPCTSSTAAGRGSGGAGGQGDSARFGLAAACGTGPGRGGGVIKGAARLAEVLAHGALAEVLQWEARTAVVLLSQQQQQRRR